MTFLMNSCDVKAEISGCLLQYSVLHFLGCVDFLLGEKILMVTHVTTFFVAQYLLRKPMTQF